VTRQNSEQVFHLYVIRTRNRQQLIDHLSSRKIQAGIHYPMPVHLQPGYKARIRTSSNMCVTEQQAEEVLSLPMYPELSSADVALVIEVVNGFASNTV
jgi:dTDP-4-amino-4,6-dideoxygalactose transaminase